MELGKRVEHGARFLLEADRSVATQATLTTGATLATGATLTTGATFTTGATLTTGAALCLRATNPVFHAPRGT